jgi:hypothetical protein
MSAVGSTPWCDQVWLCCPPCTGWLVYAVQPSHLTQPAADLATSLTATARAGRNGRDEVSMLPDVFTEAQALTTLHGLPLAVLTARETLDGTDGWGEAQDRLAALSTNTESQVVDSTHMGLLEDRVSPSSRQRPSTASSTPFARGRGEHAHACRRSPPGRDKPTKATSETHMDTRRWRVWV